MTTTEVSVSRFISEQILRSAASEAIEPDKLLLEEGVLDSLGLQQLVTFLENEYSVQFTDDHFTPENFESVRAIARFVDENKGQ
jgi:acyl carrier protein